MPVFDITGRRHVMLAPQLAGIARRQNGEPVANPTACRAGWVVDGDKIA
jgi:hypothetical protein